MIKPEKMTLEHILSASAEKFPDNPALSYVDGKPITYRELQEKVNHVSQLLAEQGIGKGDCVAILSESKPNWGIAFLAITTMGAVCVPILPDFHPNAVHHIIRHSESRAIFVSDSLYSKVVDVESNKLHSIFLIDDFHLVPKKTRKEKLDELVRGRFKEIKELRKSARKERKGTPKVNIKEDDLAQIIYTSGTTGHSKGVMLTHKNIVFTALKTIAIVGSNENDRMLSILPMSHTYECTLGFVTPIASGSGIYYLKKPPTPRLLLDAMQIVKPTIMCSVPLVIEKIYKTKILPQFTHKFILRNLYKINTVRMLLHKMAGKKLLESFGGKLRVFAIGGASLTPEVEKFLREARFPYAIGYGLTETAPLIAGTPPDKTKFRSTGPALPEVQLKIDNPNPNTGEGEIIVKAPNVMLGYYKDPERTAETFTADGWLKTGDLGVFDEDGYLYIKGRLKNVILGPSGENVYPEEIEAVLNENEFVLESLVYERNKQLIARVHLNYDLIDQQLNCMKEAESKVRQCIQNLLETLRVHVNENLSAFAKLSKIIEQTEPFEKTPTQKIKRYLYLES
ncbi:AMP-binding protein [candidate division KSB1 bacterium]|nr:AMP-binding protein [candidate division KSB1 bacterium]